MITSTNSLALSFFLVHSRLFPSFHVSIARRARPTPQDWCHRHTTFIISIAAINILFFAPVLVQFNTDLSSQSPSVSNCRCWGGCAAGLVCRSTLHSSAYTIHWQSVTLTRATKLINTPFSFLFPVLPLTNFFYNHLVLFIVVAQFDSTWYDLLVFLLLICFYSINGLSVKSAKLFSIDCAAQSFIFQTDWSNFCLLFHYRVKPCGNDYVLLFLILKLFFCYEIVVT